MSVQREINLAFFQAPASFTAGVAAPTAADAAESLWFLVSGDRLAVSLGAEGPEVPRRQAPAVDAVHYIGALDGLPCYCAGVADERALQPEYEWRGLRELLTRSDSGWGRAARAAVQIVAWDRDHRFCGRCGTPTVARTRERAKECPACGLLSFPRLSPAVIVAIVRGDRILLARSQRFRGGMYSVLAGFVEPGETLEDTVRREVREEVGIALRNIRYFGSQSWPFPNSLMLGFTAEHAGGEIRLDDDEIAAADWFRADALPEIPAKGSISRELIEWFTAGCGPTLA